MSPKIYTQEFKEAEAKAKRKEELELQLTSKRIKEDKDLLSILSRFRNGG